MHIADSGSGAAGIVARRAADIGIVDVTAIALTQELHHRRRTVAVHVANGP